MFQYLLFLVKHKGTLNAFSINEAQQKWDDLCKIFKIAPPAQPLIEYLQEINKEIYFDKRVKRLSTIKSDDELMFAAQTLAHDMLVIFYVINEPKHFKSDTPEKQWAKQLERITFTSEFEHLYDKATVLQSITNDSQKVSNLVQYNLPSFQSEVMNTCILDFGKLWQYGTQNKYLLTITRETEEAANRFLANNFAYILTLLSKIDKHYLYAVKLYEEITTQETVMLKLKEDLEKLIDTANPSFLEEKRAEVRSISEESTNNLAYIRDCGNNNQSNIINLKDALKDFNIATEEDKIFTNNLELFEEHVQNITSWVNVGQSALLRINKTNHDLQNILKERIDSLMLTSQAQEIASAIPLPTPAEQSNKVSFKWGNNYILIESEPVKSLEIFEQMLQFNKNGLCIARTNLVKLKKGRPLENANIYWLSNTSCDYCLPPNLDRILHVITPFLLTNNESIFLLEGLEFLNTNNEFNNVVKLIDNIKELVETRDSIFILSYNSPAFSVKETALINKNMIDITTANYTTAQLKSENVN